jgi:ATP-binding cassette subfamily B protein
MAMTVHAMREASAGLCRGLLDPGSMRVIELVRGSAPRLLVVLAVDAIALAVLPPTLITALGHLIGEIRDAAPGTTLGSAPGRGVLEALLLVALASGASVIAPLVHQAVAGALRVRLTGAVQARLTATVGRPTGIAHLEEPAILDSIALTSGALTTWTPADAPAALAAIWAKRATCLLAGGLISWHVWWLGPLYLLLWIAARRPIMRVVRNHVAALGGKADVMRRAEYLRRLSTRPAAGKELRTFGLSDWLIDRFRSTWEGGMAEVWRIRSGVYRSVGRIGAAVVVAYLAGAAYVAWAAWRGELGVDAVTVTLVALALTLTTGAVDFDDIALEWMLAGTPQVDELRKEVERVEETFTGSGSPPTAGPPSIAFVEVGFAYPNRPDHPVFDQVDLTLAAGASTAIVGVNGAGKTTLVKLLCRLHDPTAGSVEVDGVDLRDLDPTAWRRRIALVSQELLRLPLSARENIAAGAIYADDDDGIRDVARRAGIADAIERLPMGWDTPLVPTRTGGVALSTGQWQRIALARALFAVRHGATVLVLDEPTAAMDVRSERDFFEQFLDITAGLTTVVISHRFSTVRLADEICVLSGGRVEERGSHLELIESRGHYARMFEAQARRLAPRSERHL